MFVRVTCPACGHKIKTDEALAGRRVKCPACKHKLVVPNVDLRPSVALNSTPIKPPVAGESLQPSQKLAQLFATHALFSAEKQAMLADFLEGVNSCWKLATDPHVLRFAFVNRAEVCSFPIQYLGLLGWNEAEDASPRWRWAWDATENGYPADSLRAANQLRDQGKVLEIPEFSNAELPLGNAQSKPWFNWHFLAMIACGICGSDFYFKAPIREGLAAILLGQAPALAERYPPSAERMAFVLGDTFNKFAAALPNHRQAVVAYAHQRGYEIRSDDPRALTFANSGGKQLLVRFDDWGQIAMVESEARIAALPLEEVQLLPETETERKRGGAEAEWLAGMDAGATLKPSSPKFVVEIDDEPDSDPPIIYALPEAIPVAEESPPEALPVDE